MRLTVEKAQPKGLGLSCGGIQNAKPELTGAVEERMERASEVERNAVSVICETFHKSSRKCLSKKVTKDVTMVNQS